MVSFDRPNTLPAGLDETYDRIWQVPCRNESMGNLPRASLVPVPYHCAAPIRDALAWSSSSKRRIHKSILLGEGILDFRLLRAFDAKIATSVHHFHTSTILVQACVASPLQLNEKVGRKCIKSLPSCLLCWLGERSTIHDKSVRTPIASTNYTMPHCVAAAVR